MSIDDLINNNYEKFTENDKYICQCILNNKKDCCNLSIEKFALKYHVSKSSLSRFAQKCSLSGYSALKSIIRMSYDENINIENSISVMFESYHKMIDYMKTKNCSLIFNNIKMAKRVFIFGSGYSQAKVASEFKRIFLPTHKIMIDAYGKDMAEAIINIADKDDYVIMISLSGESETILNMAKKLNMKGVKLLSITGMKSNTLSRICEENLYISSIKMHINQDFEYNVTTPYFILVELLYIQYKMFINNVHIPNN